MEAEKVKITEYPAELHVEYRWYKPVLHAAFVVAGITGVGILLVVFFLLPENIRYVVLIVVPAELAVAYYGLTGILNKTHLKIDHLQIVITHNPLPWSKNRMIQKDEIKQIDIQEKVLNNQPYYQLNLILTNDKSIKLVGDFANRVEAEAIKKKVESYLNK